MTTKHRIALIRLSKKLDDNKEYAKKMRVNVIYRKTDIIEKQVETDKKKNI